MIQMKPETIARRERERKAEEASRRASFEINYRDAMQSFPEMPELTTLEPDRTRFFMEFSDGRAVAVSPNQWREE